MNRTRGQTTTTTIILPAESTSVIQAASTPPSSLSPQPFLLNHPTPSTQVEIGLTILTLFNTPPLRQNGTVSPTPLDLHPNPVAWIVYIPIFWLHSKFHPPFLACNTVLGVSANGVTNPEMYRGIPSAIKFLNVESIFKYLQSVLDVSTSPS